MLKRWRNYTKRLMYRRLYGGRLNWFESFLVGREVKRRNQHWRELPAKPIHLGLPYDFSKMEQRILAAGSAGMTVDEAVKLARNHPMRFPLLYSPTGRTYNDDPHWWPCPPSDCTGGAYGSEKHGAVIKHAGDGDEDGVGPGGTGQAR